MSQLNPGRGLILFFCSTDLRFEIWKTQCRRFNLSLSLELGLPDPFLLELYLFLLPHLSSRCSHKLLYSYSSWMVVLHCSTVHVLHVCIINVRIIIHIRHAILNNIASCAAWAMVTVTVYMIVQCHVTCTCDIVTSVPVPCGNVAESFRFKVSKFEKVENYGRGLAFQLPEYDMMSADAN